MKSFTRINLFVCMLLTLVVAGLAPNCWAQEDDADGAPPPQCQPLPKMGKSVPLWMYKVAATRGAEEEKKDYSGLMVGACPFTKDQPFTKTPVNTLVVWVTVNLPVGQINTVFDPTQQNPCLLDGNKPPQAHSVEEVVTESPILQNFTYGLVGKDNVLLGSKNNPIKTQYGDFFQRANFWKSISNKGGSDYQTVLSPIAYQSETAAQLLVGTYEVKEARVCGPDNYQPHAGYIEFHEWERVLGLIQRNLVQNKKLTPDTFVIFVLDSIQLCQTVNPPQNCIAGYHSAGEDMTTGDIYTWAVADFDNAGLFPAGSGDVATLSHEVGEWMDNPIILGDWFMDKNPGNQVPAWGDGIGQVGKGECQKNLEVGDPLSKGKTNPWTVTIQKPFPYTYHMQELAYFSWFYGPPTVGAGGVSAPLAPQGFSNHLTFTAAAASLASDFIKTCQPPPGP